MGELERAIREAERRAADDERDSNEHREAQAKAKHESIERLESDVHAFVAEMRRHGDRGHRLPNGYRPILGQRFRRGWDFSFDDGLQGDNVTSYRFVIWADGQFEIGGRWSHHHEEQVLRRMAEAVLRVRTGT